MNAKRSSAEETPSSQIVISQTGAKRRSERCFHCRKIRFQKDWSFCRSAQIAYRGAAPSILFAPERFTLIQTNLRKNCLTQIASRPSFRSGRDESVEPGSRVTHCIVFVIPTALDVNSNAFVKPLSFQQGTPVSKSHRLRRCVLNLTCCALVPGINPGCIWVSLIADWYKVHTNTAHIQIPHKKRAQIVKSALLNDERTKLFSVSSQLI